ncbi:hypothetical protein HELRODRAFT_181954 [Helobdella robusta]|uniref:Uncharacterized protein n=1 Tax=Helobdella robusta TaxID=6412 RepID=T1FHI3_HELRO|nr:hypothetical protein HELRODRAFT_181954 [Helobdella robusta]ESN91898.1 hypothetical protein HELRODRAFT_181954 [Helobdella robusta]
MKQTSSLVQHPDGVLIATGQVGKQPYMCVWDSTSLETISILKDAHEHGIVAIAFSTDGQLLASVGSDQSSTIVLWEWRKGKKMAVTRGHSDRVFDVQFCPQTSASDETHQQKDQRAEYLLVTCGVKHIKFWTHSGNTLTAKKGIFGNVGEIQTMLSLLVCNSSSSSNNNLLTSRSLKETKKKLDVVVHDGGELLTFSTTLSGDVYMWCACTLTKVFKSLHKGPIFTIAPYRSDQGVEGLMTGGKDGVLKIWNLNMQLMKTHDLKTDNTTADMTIRSLYQRQQQILIGTKDSEIIQLSSIRGGAGDEEVRQEVVMEGHKEGELWGLDVTKGFFATASDDKTVRIWELSSRMSVRKRSMEEGMRSCSFNHDASLLAVGMLNGSVALINTKSMKVLKAWKDRKEVIHEMKHSADGRWLAVGSNDNFVDVYDCNNDYKKVGVCTGNSSFITHLDWSVDGRYITTKVELLRNGKRVTNSEEIKNIKWLTFTGVLGNEVKGIWQKYTDTNDINATDVNDDVIATADDFGLVKLFKFPSYEKGC